MDNLDNEFFINFIIADYLPFAHADRYYFLSSPSRECRFLAEDLYLTFYKKALNEGCLSEDDISKLLKRRSLWNAEKEKTLMNLIKEADKIKIQMFELHLNSQALKNLKNLLRKTESLMEDMSRCKATFDNYSAKSVALYGKQNLLIGSSIFKAKNKPYWRKPWACFDLSDAILPDAYAVLNKYHLTDSDYRELARSSAWRNIWNVKKGIGNIFGRPLVDLTVPQRHLLAWSNLYDSVYSHSNPPPESVIEDDDILDGWMLFQKRKREAELTRSDLESKLNPNIMNSEEVFIMTGADELSPVSRDKFDIVYEMNDLQGKMAFKRRMAQIQKEGIVPDNMMKETQEQIRMQAAQRRQ